MELINETLRSILIGFGVFSILYAVSSIFSKTKVSRIKPLDESATLVARLTGILLLIAIGYDLLIGHESKPTAYWNAILFFGLTVLFTTQLLWLRRARTSSYVRVFQATMLLIALLYGRVVIVITSLHRDYDPGTENVLGSFMMQVFISFLVFTATLVTIHWIKAKRRRVS